MLHISWHNPIMSLPLSCIRSLDIPYPPVSPSDMLNLDRTKRSATGPVAVGILVVIPPAFPMPSRPLSCQAHSAESWLMLMGIHHQLVIPSTIRYHWENFGSHRSVLITVFPLCSSLSIMPPIVVPPGTARKLWLTSISAHHHLLTMLNDAYSCCLSLSHQAPPG